MAGEHICRHAQRTCVQVVPEVGWEKEDDPLPGHISNDLWRHAEDAADKGKEEVVWHELMMFLHWQKKFADEKRQFKGSSVCS
jgi:hypothetical protein